MMKNFVTIFFAFVLVLATLEADGKRLTLEKEREHILSGQASTHQLGRKVDVAAKDDKDPTANKVAATGRAAEDDSAVGFIDSREQVSAFSGRHHRFRNDTNPWPVPRPAKDYNKRTLEADGKRLTVEKERELILSGQASTHQLGRKVDVGAKDDKDPTANKGAATGRAAEDDSAVGFVDSQEQVSASDGRHHFYRNEAYP